LVTLPGTIAILTNFEVHREVHNKILLVDGDAKGIGLFELKFYGLIIIISPNAIAQTINQYLFSETMNKKFLNETKEGERDRERRKYYNG
jgi:hypothetical protein